MDPLERIEEKLDRICRGLYGTPEDPQKGLIVRVDRLEVAKAIFGKLLWILGTGLVTLAVNAILQRL